MQRGGKAVHEKRKTFWSVFSEGWPRAGAWCALTCCLRRAWAKASAARRAFTHYLQTSSLPCCSANLLRAPEVSLDLPSVCVSPPLSLQGLVPDPTLLDTSEVELVDLKFLDEEPIVVVQFTCQQVELGPAAGRVPAGGTT